ncbi:MAG: TIR domain-containing protein [Candidatus Binatia bacterium]
MARRVFFSFHYERDNWRAGQVRNSWVTKPDRESAGFWDAAAWEEVKKRGDDAIKRWIRDQMAGSSVTAVLIGRDTSTRGLRLRPSIEEREQVVVGRLDA